MAKFKLKSVDEIQFFSDLQEKKFDLVDKIVDSIIEAVDKNKKQINIFDVYFDNGDSMIFSIKKEYYKNCLENCIEVYIEKEMYEKCSVIKNKINLL